MNAHGSDIVFYTALLFVPFAVLRIFPKIDVIKVIRYLPICIVVICVDFIVITMTCFIIILLLCIPKFILISIKKIQ